MQIDEIATLTKLHTIILTKKWNIVKEEHERMFQDFCVRLMALTQEQQSLVLDLSENFDYFTLDTYDSMIAEITRTISKTISESAKIYLLPIKDKSKAGFGSFRLGQQARQLFYPKMVSEPVSFREQPHRLQQPAQALPHGLPGQPGPALAQVQADPVRLGQPGFAHAPRPHREAPRLA